MSPEMQPQPGTTSGCKNLRWSWCFSWWFVQGSRELVIKNGIKPTSLKYQKTSLTDPSFYYISYSCCLFNITVTTSVLLSPDTTGCTNRARTQLDPPLPLRNQTPPGRKFHVSPLHTAVLALEPPGNVFIVSGDVNFAQGTALPTKGRWSRTHQVPLIWENLCGFISERVQQKSVSSIMTVEPHCHLSSSRYTLPWATFFPFFFPF